MSMFEIRSFSCRQELIGGSPGCMIHDPISDMCVILCSLTNGPLTLECSLSWTQNLQASGYDNSVEG